jgi:hypothetical protein
MEEKHWEDAAKNFAHAVALNPKDPQLWVAYGDALNELTPQGHRVSQARPASLGERALDRRGYKPALDRMMSFWSDWANLNPRPEIFEALNKTAARLYAADPKNSAAEVAIVTSEVRPWLGGVEKDQTLIEKRIKDLEALIKKYPENPDLPMFAAQAKLRLAERRRQQDPENKQAALLVAEANKICEDAVARTPTAAMYFSAAQVYQAQEFADPRQAPVWRQKKKDMYAKARAVAKVDDPLYIYIHTNSARAMADDKVAAEKILRELMEKMPDDQSVRLALAEQLALNKETRAEAMGILQKPFATSGLRGPKAAMMRDLQVRTLVTLTDLSFRVRHRQARRAGQVDADDPGRASRRVKRRPGVGVHSLRLKGKLLRLNGSTVEAIQTLEKARQLAEQQAPAAQRAAGADSIDRWEVVDLLAKAYIGDQPDRSGQDAADRAGEPFPQPTSRPRMLLTQLLVKDGSYDEARPHVELLSSARTRTTPT